MIAGDLNVEVNLECMKTLCETYVLNSLFKVLTCYTNQEKFSFINLLLTKRSNTFQSSSVVDTELSDSHKMTVTVTITTFHKC